MPCFDSRAVEKNRPTTTRVGWRGRVFLALGSARLTAVGEEKSNSAEISSRESL